MGEFKRGIGRMEYGTGKELIAPLKMNTREIGMGLVKEIVKMGLVYLYMRMREYKEQVTEVNT